jgi:magnesium-transporting ATPase (P-type)
MKRKKNRSLASRLAGFASNSVGPLFRKKSTEKLADKLNPADYLESAKNIHIADQSKFVWSKLKWMDVKVGHYLIVRSDENIPADLVIISTSEPESVCFVETKNLDGETNLKVKRGIKAFSDVSTAYDCAGISAVIETAPPSEKMCVYFVSLTIRLGTNFEVGAELMESPKSRWIFKICF